LGGESDIALSGRADSNLPVSASQEGQMLFSHLCRATAVLGLIYSAIILWSAYQSGTNITDPADAKRVSDFYLNHGLTTLFYSMGLGTMAEISFSLRNKSDG
jgi:hypothetical protein